MKIFSIASLNTLCILYKQLYKNVIHCTENLQYKEEQDASLHKSSQQESTLITDSLKPSIFNQIPLILPSAYNYNKSNTANLPMNYLSLEASNYHKKQNNPVNYYITNLLDTSPAAGGQAINHGTQFHTNLQNYYIPNNQYNNLLIQNLEPSSFSLIQCYQQPSLNANMTQYVIPQNSQKFLKFPEISNQSYCYNIDTKIECIHNKTENEKNVEQSTTINSFKTKDNFLIINELESNDLLRTTNTIEYENRNPVGNLKNKISIQEKEEIKILDTEEYKLLITFESKETQTDFLSESDEKGLLSASGSDELKVISFQESEAPSIDSQEVENTNDFESNNVSLLIMLKKLNSIVNNLKENLEYNLRCSQIENHDEPYEKILNHDVNENSTAKRRKIESVIHSDIIHDKYEIVNKAISHDTNTILNSSVDKDFFQEKFDFLEAYIKEKGIDLSILNILKCVRYMKFNFNTHNLEDFSKNKEPHNCKSKSDLEYNTNTQINIKTNITNVIIFLQNFSDYQLNNTCDDFKKIETMIINKDYKITTLFENLYIMVTFLEKITNSSFKSSKQFKEVFSNFFNPLKEIESLICSKKSNSKYVCLIYRFYQCCKIYCFTNKQKNRSYKSYKEYLNCFISLTYACEEYQEIVNDFFVRNNIKSMPTTKEIESLLRNNHNKIISEAEGCAFIELIDRLFFFCNDLVKYEKILMRGEKQKKGRKCIYINIFRRLVANTFVLIINELTKNKKDDEFVETTYQPENENIDIIINVMDNRKEINAQERAHTSKETKNIITVVIDDAVSKIFKISIIYFHQKLLRYFKMLITHQHLVKNRDLTELKIFIHGIILKKDLKNQNFIIELLLIQFDSIVNLNICIDHFRIMSNI